MEDDEGGAPVTLIDMAASGIALVATDHCDINQIINDGVTGFLAKEGDIESIKVAIWKWVENKGKLAGDFECCKSSC